MIVYFRKTFKRNPSHSEIKLNFIIFLQFVPFLSLTRFGEIVMIFFRRCQRKDIIMIKKQKTSEEYRGVRDEIRTQQEKTKAMSFKGKLSYFWDYYKVHTLVAVLVIGFTISLIHTILTTKDYSFNGMMLNADNLSNSALAEGFSDYAQLDTENYECFIDTNTTLSFVHSSQYDMAASQKIIALTQAGELDAVVFDSQAFSEYAMSEMFPDLRSLFSDKELAPYRDFLYYVDYAKIRELQNRAPDDLSLAEAPALETEEDIATEAEAHRHPETMQEPVPVGIFIGESPFAKKSHAYDHSEPVFSIPGTSKRAETAKKYLAFLWEDSVAFDTMLLTF